MKGLRGVIITCSHVTASADNQIIENITLVLILRILRLAAWLSFKLNELPGLVDKLRYQLLECRSIYVGVKGLHFVVAFTLISI